MIRQQPNEMEQAEPHFWGLWVRFLIPFLVFILLGTVLLSMLLVQRVRSESRENFLSQAHSTMVYYRDSRLPESPRIAEWLGQILGVEVFLHRRGASIMPLLPPHLEGEAETLIDPPVLESIFPLNEKYEVVVMPIESFRTMAMVRPVEKVSALLLRPGPLALLAAFLVTAFGMAWVVGRGVVHPLRSLARSLPRIDDEGPLQAIEGLDRRDEIGLLARTLHTTHDKLNRERAARMQAEKLSAFTSMAAGLAHEIQNPMAAMRMHLELLAETPEAKENGALQSTIPMLQRETEKVSGLLRQWMFLLRPEPPQVASTSLRPLLNDCLMFHRPKAKHHGVELRLDMPQDFHVMADGDRLTQVMHNLILNAIQALAGMDVGEIRIAVESQAERANITVADSGPGFGDKALAQAGHLFFSTREGGMGIGLYVSREIVEAQDGRLLIRNGESGGGRVIVELPLA